MRAANTVAMIEVALRDFTRHIADTAAPNNALQLGVSLLSHACHHKMKPVAARAPRLFFCAVRPCHAPTSSTWLLCSMAISGAMRTKTMEPKSKTVIGGRHTL